MQEGPSSREVGAVKPPPWPWVLDFLVEIRTEKGTPARLINLESSTIDEEPIRRGLIDVQEPAMNQYYLILSDFPLQSPEQLKEKMKRVVVAVWSRNGDHTIRFGACTQHVRLVMYMLVSICVQNFVNHSVGERFFKNRL